MKTNIKSKQEEYISKIKQLYSEIENWVERKSFVAQKGEIEINEEIPGRYKVPSLSIQDQEGKQVAELRPIGAWIVGAKGRVDLIGQFDQNNLVYMEAGGPHIATSISIGGEKTEEKAKPLFKGIDQTGWYWIEDKRRGRARLLNAELFMDLLSEVSDYGV
ncbi:hypothetical protein KA005_02400 [bacterium]|nr:hypothetical protein [bacterium]